MKMTQAEDTGGIFLTSDHHEFEGKEDVQFMK